MKSISPLALAVCAAAVVTLNPQLADAQLSCYDLGPGQACTNYLGQESRCSQTNLCMTSLKECSSTSTLLQSCSPAYTSLKYIKFCYPMLGEGKPMQCMESEDIDTLVKRGQCADKSNGAPCKSAYTEADTKTGLSANVYEEEGFCEDGYCLSTFFSACNDGNIGASCTAKGVFDSKLRQYTGTCVKRTPYRPRCNFTTNGAVIGPATVILGATPVPTTAAPTRTPTPTTGKPTSSSSGVGADSESNNSGVSSLFTLSPVSRSTSTPTPTPTSAAALPSVVVCATAVLSAALAFLAL